MSDWRRRRAKPCGHHLRRDEAVFCEVEEYGVKIFGPELFAESGGRERQWRGEIRAELVRRLGR